MTKIVILILVILFGILLLLKNMFKWNISLFKVFFGIAIVAIGVSLLTDGVRVNSSISSVNSSISSSGSSISSSESSIRGSESSIRGSESSINSSINSGGSSRGGGSGSQHTQHRTAAGNSEEIIFGSRNYSATGSGNFSYIFSGGSIDLRQLPPGAHTITVDVIFASMQIYVRPDQSARINADAAFGRVQLPNGDSTFLGRLSRGEDNNLTIAAHAVFGSIDILER